MPMRNMDYQVQMSGPRTIQNISLGCRSTFVWSAAPCTDCMPQKIHSWFQLPLSHLNLNFSHHNNLNIFIADI